MLRNLIRTAARAGKRSLETVSTSRICRNCSLPHTGAPVHFCDNCGTLLPPLGELSYFKLYDLEEKFSIDALDLQKRFRRHQAFVHPDRFVDDAASKEDAHTHSSLANAAYQTLLDPYTRALYYLERRGHTVAEDHPLPGDFLAEVFELNEEVEDAVTSGAVGDILTDVEGRRDEYMHRVAAALEADALLEAVELLARVNYFRNLVNKLKDKLHILLYES